MYTCIGHSKDLSANAEVSEIVPIIFNFSLEIYREFCFSILQVSSIKNKILVSIICTIFFYSNFEFRDIKINKMIVIN